MNPTAKRKNEVAGFQLQRMGVVMEPEPGNPLEAEGVLNPASARGRDGQLYLFPRLVSAGNYSRIGIARVLFNEAVDPVGVDLIGIALQPVADYDSHATWGEHPMAARPPPAHDEFGPGLARRRHKTK